MRMFVTPAGTRALLKFIEENQQERLLYEVRNYKPPRSLGLNALHWASVINPLAEFIGDSPEETHRDLCGAFFGWVDTKMGGKKPRRTTTTNDQGERSVLNWEEMSNFVEFCRAKAAELGVQT